MICCQTKRIFYERANVVPLTLVTRTDYPINSIYFTPIGETYHREVLSKICRICSEPALKSACPTTRFAIQLKTFFGIDVNKEDSSIYPQKLCSRHVSLMYRVKTAQEKGKSIATTSDLVDFVPHQTEFCDICGKFDSPPPNKKQKTEAIATYQWSKFDGESSSLLEECTKLTVSGRIELIVSLIETLTDDER